MFWCYAHIIGCNVHFVTFKFILCYNVMLDKVHMLCYILNIPVARAFINAMHSTKLSAPYDTALNYMSPPAGDIYGSCLWYVRRLPVPRPSLTVILSEPCFLEPIVKGRNVRLFFTINIPTEVLPQKIKICPTIFKFWPKTKKNVLNLHFDQASSQ